MVMADLMQYGINVVRKEKRHNRFNKIPEDFSLNKCV